MESEPYFLFALKSIDVTLLPFTTNVIIELIIFCCLLVFSALISGSEVAYFSLSPKNIETLKKSKTSSDELIIRLFHKPERLLATILISNNFINVGIVILASFITTSLVDFSTAKTLGFIVQVILITFFLLLFGEILPKVYASQFCIKFARFMAIPLNILDRLLKPFTYILISSTGIVNKRFQKKHNISIEDISEAINITSNDIKKDERRILKGIVKFGNKDVKEIMQPRIDVFAVDIQENFTKLIHLIIESGFSRIPVFEDTFDKVKGILFVKDLLPYINQKDEFVWQNLIKPPYFVPETKMIDDLLEEFRKNKIHMAIVVDEYGGTSGIITMEDIIEEIVGEIKDEKDSEEFLYYKIDANNYLFEGKIFLNDFYKITHLNDDIFDEVKGEAETLAGLILEIKGEIPNRNDKIVYKQFEFNIESVDERRIKRIKFTINPNKTIT